MAKYVVTVSLHGYSHYSTVVEAETPKSAKRLAGRHSLDLDWHYVGVSEVNGYRWNSLDPFKVKKDFSIESDFPEEKLAQVNHPPVCPVDAWST